MADKELRKVIGSRAKERRLELGLSGQDIDLRNEHDVKAVKN